MEYIKKIRKLSEGSSSIVYKCENLVTKKSIATKEIKQQIADEGIPAQILREISLLKELKHKNIVGLENVFVSSSQIVLLFEYVTMDLKTYIRRLPSDFQFTQNEVQSYLHQITTAVSFCHQRRVFHRDLCPQNVLISRKGIIKIADFGMARSFEIIRKVYTHDVAVLHYRSPEVLLGSTKYSPAIDVWSIGCIFVELFLRKPVFQGDSEINQLQKIFDVLGMPSKADWPEIENLPYFFQNASNTSQSRLKDHIKCLKNIEIHLLKQMFQYNPMHRISAKRILQHPYLASFNANLRIPTIF